MSARQVSARGARLDWWDALIVAYAAVAASFRPLTLPAAIAVLLAGAVLIAVMARHRVPLRRMLNPGRAALPWAVLALLVAGWELTALFWGNDSAHPTLSLLLDPVLDTYIGRLVGYLAWLAVGRWLVTR